MENRMKQIVIAGALVIACCTSAQATDFLITLDGHGALPRTDAPASKTMKPSPSARSATMCSSRAGSAR